VAILSPHQLSFGCHRPDHRDTVFTILDSYDPLFLLLLLGVGWVFVSRKKFPFTGFLLNLRASELVLK